MQTAPRSANAVNMLLLQSHISEPIAVETMLVYGESTEVILRAIGPRFVEVTREPREVNWFHQNLTIAIQRGNALSILSAGRENFWRVGGIEVHPTPHFVLEGISSSMRNFIFLVFNFEVFKVFNVCE